MAANTGEGYRKGPVKNRVQVKNDDGHWVKINPTTDDIIEIKMDFDPFKGVAKSKDDRRNDEY